MITEKPEETKFVLNYFSSMPNKNDIGLYLINLIKENRILYYQQISLIIKWLFDEEIYHENIKYTIREMLKNSKLYHNSRNYCIAYLSKFGDYIDHDIIELLYNKNESSLSNAIVMIGIKNMEKTRRNAIYANASKDHFLIENSIKFVKDQEPKRKT